MIELTPEQQRILDTSNGSPPLVIDPRTGTTYSLMLQAISEQSSQKPPANQASFEIPEGILRSRAALRRDLPELLARRRNLGKLVCYAKEERIGISDDYVGLIKECVRRNIPDNEFIIEIIGPRAGIEEEEEFDARY